MDGICEANTMKNDFPSLRLGYEQIKDVLKEQKEINRDYLARAMTLFSVSTAVIGIGLPLMFTQKVVSLYLVKPLIPLTTLSVIPILIYAVIVFYTYSIWKKESLVTMENPTLIKDEFLELDESKFYSDMIQHIESGFIKNEKVIQRRAQHLSYLTNWVIIETSIVVLFAIVFSALT
jgi:hypothetical protein